MHRFILKISVIVSMIFVLQACRYWSLYQFGDQLCSYEENVYVEKQQGQINVAFANPVLKRTLLHRYLGVLPTSESIHDYRHRDIFILGNHDDLDKRFKVTVDYSTLDQDYLMMSARLGPVLSQAFNPRLVNTMLQSFCVDDYDVGLKQIVLSFKLDKVPAQELPSLDEIRKAFGHSMSASEEASSSLVRYRLGFVSLQDGESGFVSNRDVLLEFYGGARGRVNRIVVNYYRYQYEVDLIAQRGQLIAIKSDAIK